MASLVKRQTNSQQVHEKHGISSMDVLLAQVNKNFSLRPKYNCSSSSSSEGATICLEGLGTNKEIVTISRQLHTAQCAAFCTFTSHCSAN